MKEKKFEKVVEWDEEPKPHNLVSGFLILSLIVLCVLFGSMVPNEDLSPLIILIYTVVSLIGTGWSLYLFIDANGEGKKTYWREVK